MNSGSDEIVVGNKNGLYTYDDPAEIEQNDLVVFGDQYDGNKPHMWVVVEKGHHLWFSTSGLSFWIESVSNRKIRNKPHSRVYCASICEPVYIDYDSAYLVFLSGSRPAIPAGFYREDNEKNEQIISYFDGKGHYWYYDPNTRSFGGERFDEYATPKSVEDIQLIRQNTVFSNEE